jgi:hypothetical protein
LANLVVFKFDTNFDQWMLPSKAVEFLVAHRGQQQFVLTELLAGL